MAALRRFRHGLIERLNTTHPDTDPSFAKALGAGYSSARRRRGRATLVASPRRRTGPYCRSASAPAARRTRTAGLPWRGGRMLKRGAYMQAAQTAGNRPAKERASSLRSGQIRVFGTVAVRSRIDIMTLRSRPPLSILGYKPCGSGYERLGRAHGPARRSALIIDGTNRPGPDATWFPPALLARYSAPVPSRHFPAGPTERNRKGQKAWPRSTGPRGPDATTIRWRHPVRHSAQWPPSMKREPRKFCSDAHDAPSRSGRPVSLLAMHRSANAVIPGRGMRRGRGHRGPGGF